VIERQLHPIPEIKGIQILHRHVGQKIEFTAWRGNDQINNKSLLYDRSTIGFYKGRFYNDSTIKKDFNWLVQ